jgi:hypothetical protein
MPIPDAPARPAVALPPDEVLVGGRWRHAATPFSGTKASGLGVEKGRHGIRAYMRHKSIYWGLNSGPLGWAAP